MCKTIKPHAQLPLAFTETVSRLDAYLKATRD